MPVSPSTPPAIDVRQDQQPKPLSDSKPLLLQWTLFLLILALLAVSFAAIFIRWSSVELGAGAIVFNRLWLATLVLMVWEGLKVGRSPQTNTPVSIQLRDYGLLFLVGAVSSTSVVLWALSLTETSVANSTVLRNLTPLLTS
ncbi:MAG: EamA family transporter, partial [Limnothrix sp.]